MEGLIVVLDVASVDTDVIVTQGCDLYWVGVLWLAALCLLPGGPKLPFFCPATRHPLLVFIKIPK